MPGVTLKRNVVLRAVVTEQLKQDLQDELLAAAETIEQRIQQIDFQTKAYITEVQRRDLQQAMQLRKQIETEKQKQQEVHDALLLRKEEVAKLELGAEVVRGTLESYVEVKEGDDLAELLGGVEVVTKDDLVIEIRQHKPLAVPEEPVIPMISADADTG